MCGNLSADKTMLTAAPLAHYSHHIRHKIMMLSWSHLHDMLITLYEEALTEVTFFYEMFSSNSTIIILFNAFWASK